MINPSSNYITEIQYSDKNPKHSIEYDEQNRPIKLRTFYTPTPTVQTSVVYLNNKINHITKSLDYYNSELSYLDNGNISITHKIQGVTYIVEFEFLNNFLIKENYSRNDIPNYKAEKVYTYDSSQNLKKIEFFERKELVSFTEYNNYDNKVNPFFYDSKNWTIVNYFHQIDMNYGGSAIISKNNPQIIKTTTLKYDGKKYIPYQIVTFNQKISYNENNLPAGVDSQAVYEIYNNGIKEDSFEVKSELLIKYKD